MNGSAAEAAVALAAAFWVCWRYRATGQLLALGPDELRPVTLEDQQTIEWIEALRAPPKGRHAKGRRAPDRYSAAPVLQDKPSDSAAGTLSAPAVVRDPYLR